MSPSLSAPNPRDERDRLSSTADSPSILDHWIGLLRRHWQVAAGVWIGVMALVGLVLWMLPRQYESSAQFLVKNARQDVVVGPFDQTSSVYREEVPEEIMNTELELLRSREVVTRVVDELDLDKGYLARGMDKARASELAVRDLAGGLAAMTLRKTNLIQVSYMNPDAELSREILRRVAEAYLAAHLSIHANPGTYELFKTQGEQASRELQQAQEDLAHLARTSNLVLPDEQKRQMVGQMNDAHAEYLRLTGDMRDMAGRIRAAESKKLEIPQRLQTSVRNLPSQMGVEHINSLLVELHNKRTELVTKFNDNDRLVQQVDRQIAETTASLNRAQAQTVNEESTDVNPAWIELESESLRAQLALAGMTRKATELQQTLAQYRTRTTELSEASPRYEILARRVAQAQVKFDLYVKKEEEARIAQALDQQRISNVVLAQAPFVSAVPAKPDVKLGLIAGASAATLLSACAVIAFEHLGAIALFIRRRRTVSMAGESAPVATATAHP